MASLISALKHKWLSPPKEVQESYAGRNVIVTGATAGIGYEAVEKFAALGASKVIIAARDLRKGDATKAAIEGRVGKNDQLEVWELNMGSYESVVAFAMRAHALDHLDIAILNAGVRKYSFMPSEYGWEEDLQVNTLSSVLLGILLLPKLKESKQINGKIPILEFVNSGLHQNAIVDAETRKAPSILQAYNTPERFNDNTQYCMSKVFLMYATNQLAKSVSSGDVIVTSVCPGWVATDLAREYQFFGRDIVFALVSFSIMRSPSQAANTILSGTTQGEQLHGRFWQHDEIQPISPSVAGEENIKFGLRVWNEIVETLIEGVPVVTKTQDSLDLQQWIKEKGLVHTE
ncbi:short-chain dehydrogenase/reductase family protein-like protein [Massariosphaeria phaeospora]|uniref:Short-chain dehydrogenase/reductase family protein-like protein n=1 Tax=Massariosphaeria phaeospora TaxID=100035 RepID=A0A7C8MAQ1_9PLEO|nr:short-chain dehydrogenase/reductase family protein-like protein [Massariosphaeria phaeospora]